MRYPVEHAFLPCNTKGNPPYFAIGGLHWDAKGARNFMGDTKEWRAQYRKGWRIVKVRLVPVQEQKRRKALEGK